MDIHSAEKEKIMLFRNIVGQQEIKNALIQMVKTQRISHAQLFLGPEGSGNLPMAIAYAQYISCQHKSEEDSCGNCSSCVKFNKLVHPDLHFALPVTKRKDDDKSVVSESFLKEWRAAFLENPYLNVFEWMEALDVENKQLTINVRECDEIVKKLSLKPYESEYKVMIIWMPEKLHHAAAPKLLKILEEPSDKTVFILVAESYEQILPTILSRTQLVKFGKINDADISLALVEKLGITAEAAATVAAMADGNYLEALKLAAEEADESFAQKNFLPWMRLCFGAFEKENMIRLVDKVEEIAKIGRERQKNFLSYSLQVFRDCLMQHYTGGSLSKLKGDDLKKFARFVNETNILKLSDEYNGAISDIERNINAKTLFLDLSIKTARLLKGG